MYSGHCWTRAPLWTKRCRPYSERNKSTTRVAPIVMSFMTRCLIGIFPTVSRPPLHISLFFFISHLHDNINELYDNVVHPANEDTRKADQAHQDRVDDTVGQQVAASSSGGGEDGEEEEDDHLWKRKIQNTRCSGDERPSGRNDNDHEHNDENGFMGEHQSMYLGETILMTFPTLFVRATLSFMRIASWRWVESTRPKRKT